jgi:hypothetical protein
MNTVVVAEPRAASVEVTADAICVALVDGRTVSVPLAWSWRLLQASPQQRANVELLGSGAIIRWPEVDEDISVEGMLWGTPAPRPSTVVR